MLNKNLEIENNLLKKSINDLEDLITYQKEKIKLLENKN